MHLPFFTQEIYHTRRAQLAATVGSGFILLPSNEECGINYKDNTYPYRQDSSLLYFTGINRAGLCLLIDCENGQSILIGDELTTEDIVWTGPLPTLKELADHAAIDRIIPTSKGIELIQKVQSQGAIIHYLPIYRGDHAFRLASILNKPIESIANGFSEILAKAVVALREIKSDEEIYQLEQAINTSGEMHKAMMTYARIGMTEAEVVAKVRSICMARNVDIPYGVILTVNGQTLHNHSYHNTLQSGQLLLGDFGAESPMLYAGDITRTIPVDKSFTSFQKEIYQIVLNTLNHSIHAVRTGVTYKSIHLAAATHITEGLKQLGLLRGDANEIVAAGAHALFFPHGLGHPLGLDVHDMEGIGEQYTGYEPGLERSKEFGLKSLRLAKSLKTGMVITVEPGIYFIPELIQIWKNQNKFSQYINYDKIEKCLPFGGVRLEDNVLVKEHDYKILGNPIPKEIQEVESLRTIAYQ